MKYGLPILMFFLTLSACALQPAPLPATPAPAPVSTKPPAPTPPSSPTRTPIFTPSPTSEADFAIIGYLPDYREPNPGWGQFLTDIIYFSAEPRPDGTLDTNRLREDTFQALQVSKAQYGTRIHLSVGGWERSSGFAAMSADPVLRRVFLASLLDFALAHDLDGVDFDWEFPENEAELQNYLSLLSEARDMFSQHGMTVSVALSPDFTTSLQAYSVVDRIHIMSYDRGAQHATYQQAVEDLQTFIDAGLPREKLILGVPFYGRNHAPPYKVLAYAEIMNRYHPPANLDEVDDIYFNGIATIQQKTCLALNEHAGGVMLWELGQDSTGDTSLLQAIHRTVVVGCKP
ncbi:MAG: glycosyl hydrolase family 18 protein [Chloroflexota bacterium]